MAILSTRQANRTKRICVFGPPKAGKTTLLGQLAELGFRVLWIDIENGSDPLFKLSPAAQEKVDLVKIPDTSANPCAAQVIAKMVQQRGKISFCEVHGNINCPACKKEGKELVNLDLNTLNNYDFVVIDSMTKLQSSVMALRMVQTGRAFDAKPEWDDFAIQGRTMEFILSWFEQVKFNFAITSHELEVELEDGSKKLVPIAGSSNYSRTSGKFFDEVIYLRIEGTKRKGYSCETTNPKIACGSRGGVALEQMAELSIRPFVSDILAFPERKVEPDSTNSATDSNSNHQAAQAISPVDQAKQAAATSTPAKLSIGGLKLGGNK